MIFFQWNTAFRMHLLLLLLLFCSITLGVAKYHRADTHGSRSLPEQDIDSSHVRSLLLEHRDSKPFALRIMPLGASITWGLKSPDGNGYRKFLRDNLTSDGWEVNMVGSGQHGTMKNNENEGHPGYRIDQIDTRMKPALSQQPNLILLNAGTNDAIQHHWVPTAGRRMDKLIDDLYEAIPGTTIILSTLLTNKLVPHTVANISEQFREIVKTRQNAGKRIVLAEMGNDAITASELVDTTHPDEQGYNKMAQIWVAAINDAVSKGFVSKPVEVKGVDDSNGGEPAKSHLTEAQKIIIGILVPLFFITIAAAIFYVYRRWSRRKMSKETDI